MKTDTRSAQSRVEDAALKKIRHTVGSKNVFADLGLEQAEEYLHKSTLAVRINDRIAELHLTQRQAAEMLGVDQPKVSLLKRGLLDGFSIARLMKFVRLLGQPHDITPSRRNVRYFSRPALKNAHAFHRIRYSASSRRIAAFPGLIVFNAGFAALSLPLNRGLGTTRVYAPEVDVGAQVGARVIDQGYIAHESQAGVPYGR